MDCYPEILVDRELYRFFKISRQIKGRAAHLIIKLVRYQKHSNVWLKYMYEPRCEKICIWGFRPGMTKPVQSQKMASYIRGMKILIQTEQRLCYLAKVNAVYLRLCFRIYAKRGFMTRLILEMKMSLIRNNLQILNYHIFKY